jgi:peroxiredoxin
MARFRWSPEKCAEEDAKSPIAVIKLNDKEEIQLNVYHKSDGIRPQEERDALRGKRVRVTGVPHKYTPSQSSPTGIPMATMTSPYIQMESIEAID